MWHRDTLRVLCGMGVLRVQEIYVWYRDTLRVQETYVW